MAGGYDPDRPLCAADRAEAPPKPRWDLLPLGPVAAVVEVLTFGGRKHPPDGRGMYRAADGPDHQAAVDGHYAAALRHLVAWRRGETLDPESGLPNLAHAVSRLLVLLWYGGAR